MTRSSGVAHLHRLTLIPGDGIGPEVSAAVVRILQARRRRDRVGDRTRPGVAAVAQGDSTLPKRLLDSIVANKVALKGPVTTPVGEGFTSVNVGLRKALDLYANLRPVYNLPGVPSRFTNVDMVIVRENTEDLYAGLEHQIVPGVVESLKIITAAASERIAEFAFAHADGSRPQDGHRGAQGEHHEARRRALSRQRPHASARSAIPPSTTRNASSTPRACGW